MQQTLHWLSIKQIIRKTNLVLIYEIEHGTMPRYLKEETFMNIISVPGRILPFHPLEQQLQKSLFFEGVLWRRRSKVPTLNICNRKVFNVAKNIYLVMVDNNGILYCIICIFLIYLIAKC